MAWQLRSLLEYLRFSSQYLRSLSSWLSKESDAFSWPLQAMYAHGAQTWVHTNKLIKKIYMSFHPCILPYPIQIMKFEYSMKTTKLN